MNWLHGFHWHWVFDLRWVHEISQSALAAAVATLGLVILLELRSISRLRRAVDNHLTRVFEQLDLMRVESQQLIEAQTRIAAKGASLAGAASRPAPARVAAAPTPVASLAPPAMSPPAYQAPPLAGGEARLLAALTAARARLGASGSSVVHQETA
jgi:hypothetical protein